MHAFRLSIARPSSDIADRSYPVGFCSTIQLCLLFDRLLPSPASAIPAIATNTRAHTVYELEGTDGGRNNVDWGYERVAVLTMTNDASTAEPRTREVLPRVRSFPDNQHPYRADAGTGRSIISNPAALRDSSRGQKLRRPLHVYAQR
jgi:hypothetical protein